MATHKRGMLHVYYLRAMDMMLTHLCTGAPPLTAANVPPILGAPAAADRITFASGVLTIPD